VDASVIARDDPRLLQPPEPLPARRRRQIDRFGKGGLGHASLALQGGEDLEIDGVELRWAHGGTMSAAQMIVNCPEIEHGRAMDDWLPKSNTLPRPRYLSLVGRIVEAIETGRIKPGERLPTHRALADRLGLSVQTISRAYEEL